MNKRQSKEIITKVIHKDAMPPGIYSFKVVKVHRTYRGVKRIDCEILSGKKKGAKFFYTIEDLEVVE